jgi:hypothetical protein
MLRVFAYLDPGSAGLLLQMIGGGVAALVVAIKLFWGRILRFLHIRTDDPDAESVSPPDPG